MVALWLMALVGSPSLAADPPLEDVAIQFHWLNQFEFAGFYMAKEKGFYEQAGLNVTILPYEKGQTDVVETVTSNQAQYGVGYSSLIYDYHQDRPVVALAALFQDSPLVLMVRDDGDISTPEDLRGRKVMFSGDALNSAPIMALLFSHGLLRTDVIKLDHSYNINDLLSGRTDAVTAYISNEPFHMRQQGHGFRIFDPKEAGLSFYGNLLFSSQAEVRDHPDRTKAFVQATLRGWRYAFDHVDETVNLIRSRYNEQNKSADALRYEAEALRDLAFKESIPLGTLDPGKLEKTSDAYRLMGIKLSGRSLDQFVWDGAKQRTRGNLVFSEAEKAFITETRIKAATTTNWPPFSFVDPQTNTPMGIGRDFWQVVVETAGLQSQTTHFSSFINELNALKEKRQDVIYSAGETEERKQYALFTVPYASFPVAIATSKDEHFIPNPSYLEGKKIAVGRNFTAHKMMVEAFPDFDYLPVKNVRAGLEEVTRGNAFAFVDIMPVLAHSINRHGYTNLKISGDTGLQFDLRIMVRDDYPQLLTIANKVISSLSPVQKREILNRWNNVQYQQGADFTRYVPYGIGVLILASVIFTWMYRAKRQAEQAEQALTIKSSDLERTNADLHETMRQLEYSNTELQSFAYVASHDLREPLRMISSYLELLARRHGDKLNGEAHEFIDYAVGGAHRMDELINSLLQYSRVQTHGVPFAPTHSNEIVAAALKNLDTFITEVGGEVTVHDLPPVLADGSQLLQLFQNLIANSLKYCAEDRPPRVGIGARADGEMVQFHVSDNGIGMESQYFERIFEIFQRLHGREQYGGTGIGLAVCKKIVEHHYGRIWVESTPGQGSTFFFTLPKG
ncbi:ABC transporter substrate-binding protein [Magnetospira sp. QH-2]|uniref:ABC transporter substrate-binding protein n=1 Tax=Magnetospira sp. (strain QH-2) TaxID=1288970 RepID=UPI00130DCCB1|nr:ABC transporter substrate-binding protein [Magnetospira sp. QH-2]